MVSKLTQEPPFTKFDPKVAQAWSDLLNNFGPGSTNDLTEIPHDPTQPIGGTPGTPIPTPPAGAVDWFPADPALAPFPSPENSQIVALAGVLGGRPYLKDLNGAIHQIKIDATGLAQYYKNGTMIPSEPVGQCLVRQGNVFMSLTNGIWKFVQANGSMYNAALPPAFGPEADGLGTATPPSVPSDPVRSTIAPGSSGRIINCGSGQALTTLSAAIPTAQSGDEIQLSPGTYTDTPPSWNIPLLIDLGGATLDATGQTATLAHGKGLLVPSADSVIQNGTIIGVAMDQTDGQLTSAIRPDAGCGYLTIKKMSLHNNQCGVGEGGIGSVVIELDDCDISDNGLKVNGGSLTHNLYVGADCVRLTLTNVVSINPTEAHAIKYRGPVLIVNGGTFAAPNGSCIDMPNGTTKPFAITNAIFIKTANDGDHNILRYGEEGATNGAPGGTINGGVIQALCANPSIIGTGGTITIAGATITGNKISALQGVVVNGI